MYCVLPRLFHTLRTVSLPHRALSIALATQRTALHLGCFLVFQTRWDARRLVAAIQWGHTRRFCCCGPGHSRGNGGAAMRGIR